MLTQRRRSVQEWWDNPEVRAREIHWSFDPTGRRRMRKVERAVAKGVRLALERVAMDRL